MAPGDMLPWVVPGARERGPKLPSSAVNSTTLSMIAPVFESFVFIFILFLFLFCGDVLYASSLFHALALAFGSGSSYPMRGVYISLDVPMIRTTDTTSWTKTPSITR